MEEGEDVIKIKLPKFNRIEISRVRENPWIMSTFVLIILVVVLVINGSGSFSNIDENIVSESVVEGKALSLAQLQDPNAEVVKIDRVSGLYKVIVLFQSEETPLYMTLDGKNLVSGLVPLELILTEDSEAGNTPTDLDGPSFTDTGDEIILDENGKPYIILFSTTWCSHCQWIKDTFDSLAQRDYADEINLQHWQLDTGDNTLTPEVETEVPAEIKAYFDKYSSEGSVPTFVFGGKYVRIGNAHESSDDLNAELEDFDSVISRLLE